MEYSIERKILKVAFPVLGYMFLSMIVQLGFSFYTTWKEFKELNKGDYFNYMASSGLIENIDSVVNAHSLLIMLITAVIACPVFIFIIKKDRNYYGDRNSLIQIMKIKPLHICIIIFMGISGGSGISKLVTLFPIDDIIGSYENVQSTFMENSMFLQVMVLVFAAPIIEEIIFRGIIYYRIKKYSDSIKAMYISSMIFGIYHGNLIQGIYGFVLGIILCYVYEKYKTIIVPVLLHVSANGMALFMYKLPVSNYISNNIFLKVIVMIIELIIFILLVRKNEKIFERED